MLKNKNKTKQILNEWRKVLNDGLYDQDPELLEEGFKEIAMAATLGLGAMLGGFGKAEAAPTKDNMIQIMQQAGEVSKSPEKSLHLLLSGIVSFLEGKGVKNISYKTKELIAKLSDKKIHDLSDTEIAEAATLLKMSRNIWNDLLEEAEAAVKNFKDMTNNDNQDEDALDDARLAAEAALQTCKTYGDLFKSIDGEFKSIEGFDIKGLGIPWRKLIKISLDGKEIFKSRVEGFK